MDLMALAASSCSSFDFTEKCENQTKIGKKSVKPVKNVRIRGISTFLVASR